MYKKYFNILLILFFTISTGCGLFKPGERWEDAPELTPALIEADGYIWQHFGKSFCDLSAISLYWGEESEMREGNIIFIDRKLKGQDVDIACHMRHELFHLTTGIYDNGTKIQYYNGVKISDWIAWSKE